MAATGSALTESISASTLDVMANGQIGSSLSVDHTRVTHLEVVIDSSEGRGVGDVGGRGGDDDNDDNGGDDEAKGTMVTFKLERLFLLQYRQYCLLG